ncbi:translocation/assembly module TamB domain-containing protein [Thermus arciformis]|nr:translocation/assembly module TamB domain-containing protein [Thermus arciformis]
MRRGFLLLLGFALLLLLLAWPSLLRLAVERGLVLAGFKGQVQEVRGHLLLGLRLRGVVLKGEGLALEAEEVRLGYDLLGLLRKELPVSLVVRGAKVRPTWEALIPEKPGPPPAIRVVFRQLRLEETQVELPKGERLFLPPVRLTLLGENPYTFVARLPGGSFQGEARALAPDLSAWEVRYQGEVRGLSFFYEGLKGGRLWGSWRLGPGGLEGENRVEGGVVELVGFLLTGVKGEVAFREDRVEARLQGVGLEGPLQAQVEVDLEAPRYRFQVEGRPRLPALARHFGLALPVEGDGALWLRGEGWEALRLLGGFQGEGRLWGEPFRHRGRLSFDRVFALGAEAEGRLFDRTYALALDLKGGGYRLDYRDSLGSALGLFGEGSAVRGEGLAAWPRPLEGLARVAFQGEGRRWRLRVQSPGVRLPLFRPLDLSGEVAGEGGRVGGRLGPLALEGPWEDLALALGPVPLVVGRLEGEGRLRGGRLEARLRYTSPYAAFPLSLRQEGTGFRFQSPYGEGSYRGGALALRLRGLPIRALDALTLSGEALYREGALSGRLRLEGRYLDLEAALCGLGADLKGRLQTPLGALPLAGAYDPGEGLRLRAQGLLLTYREALRLRGEAALGPWSIGADLALGEGFSGSAWVRGPYGLEGRLLGEGKRLRLRLSGPLEGEGEVFPRLQVEGRLALPLPEGLELPPLAFRLDREGLGLPGVGRVSFPEGAFRLDLPFRYRGEEGRLWGEGNPKGGFLRLTTRYGALEGRGPWGSLALLGEGEAPFLGPWRFRGRADLPGLRYGGEAFWPRAGLRLSLAGEGLKGRLLGQAPGLRVLGGYGEGVSLLLQAEGYDLAPLGLPLKAWGTWGTKGGRLRLESPYGEASFLGEELLRARVRLLGPYVEGEGEVSPQGAALGFRARYLGEGVAVEAWGEGGGPWGDLRFQLAGEARLPYQKPLPFRGEVWTAGGVGYRLEGPVSLEGQGLRYRGRLDLPLALLGKEGRVLGSFQGEGLRLQGEGEGVWAGLPFAFQGGYGEGASLRLRFPGGEVAWRGEEVALDLKEVAPLAQALGVPLEGQAEARLSLRGEGEGKALLGYGGEVLEATYRGTSLRLFLPRRGVGLAWDWRTGEVEGLGEVQGGGLLRLPPGKVEGRFAYRGLEVELSGPLGALDLRARYAEEALGETLLTARLDLLALRGEGEVRHASAYAQGQARLSWEGRRYLLEGRLRGLRYLEEEGPFRLEGEGERFEARWEAPLALGARREGGWTLWAKGKGEVLGFRVAADLAYGPGGYRGALEAEGRGLVLLGEGKGPLGLRLRGEGLEAEATLEDLRLLGEARYAYALGQARLEARARLAGTLPKVVLEGEGALAGQGERLPFRFAYRPGEAWDVRALEAFGEAEGFHLVLKEGRLSLRLDRDLAPFGLPVRLKAQGEGSWDAPFGVVLEGKEGRLSGEVALWPLRAELSGEVLGEAVFLRYGEALALSFLGPRLRGEALYREGLSGALALRYPLPGGGVEGRVDLARGTWSLEGQGAWQGRLEGGFCLPPPLGPCPGLRAELKGGLGYGELVFTGAYRYAAREGYLGEVAGEGTLATPYGGLRLLGRGLGLDLQGADLPLEGRLELNPFRLAYRYQGALPRGLGELSATGVYPGAWLSGRYRLGEVVLALEGLPGFRVALEGEGLKGEVGPEGVSLAFTGFRYGPLAFTGKAQGPWAGLLLEGTLLAWGRRAEVEGSWNGEGLRLAFSGDLEGEAAWKGVWAGRLGFREGWVALSGPGVPELEGEVLGEAVRLRWPRLAVGGLWLDLGAREVGGRGRLFSALVPQGVEAWGEGGSLRLAYRLPGLGLPLEGEVDLKDFSLALTSPEGEGSLRYGGGRLSGRLSLDLGGLALTLLGEGDRLGLLGEHGPYPWWAAGEGRLEGEVDLSGAYRLAYAAGPQRLTLTGRLLEAVLEAEGPYASGRLTYPAGGDLRVDLPLPPLEGRFRGRVGGEGYGVEGVLEAGGGRVLVEGRLLPLRGELVLEEAALEDFVARYAPYLRGRVSGRLRLEGLEARGALSGRVEVAGTALPFRFSGDLGVGLARGEGQLGETPFRLDLEAGRLDLRASPRAFPLHLLLAAVAGPLEGEAYWTGEARLRLPLADPWGGQGVLVGESLVFRGGGDELRGRAALRYGGKRLYVDQFHLSGKGTWEGKGYWSPEGSDLYLVLRDTVFTPVLQVVPALKPYRPEGSGTLVLRLKDEGFQVDFRDFRFRLGPVAGYLPEGLLSLNGGARAEGELRLLAPFPGRARLGLEGSLSGFRVTAKGAVSLPGLKEDTPAEVAFRYPTYGVEIRLGEALAQGTLFPLRLAGYGRLPLSYPQYYLQEGLLDVKGFFLYEEKGAYRLTGNAEVVRARLALPEGSPQRLQEGVAVGEGKAALPLFFDGVRLYAERGVLVQESLAQGELKGEVYLGGSYQDPFLTGEVTPLWGNFRLWDSLFALDPTGSSLRFRPDRGLLPEFALKAQAETRGYKVFLEATGEFLREGGRVKVRLEPRFASEPPLSEPEIYALLTLGTPDVARLTETLPQVALGAALENLVLGQLERELSRALGLDRFQVQVPLLQGGGLEETRFSIGKYLSPELFLGYEVDLRGEQTFSAQYRRDGFTFTLSSTFLPGDGRLARFGFALGYDLTEALGVSLSLEANDAVRFSVGAAYRW